MGRADDEYEAKDRSDGAVGDERRPVAGLVPEFEPFFRHCEEEKSAGPGDDKHAMKPGEGGGGPESEDEWDESHGPGAVLVGDPPVFNYVVRAAARSHTYEL